MLTALAIVIGFLVLVLGTAIFMGIGVIGFRLIDGDWPVDNEDLAWSSLLSVAGIVIIGLVGLASYGIGCGLTGVC